MTNRMEKGLRLKNKILSFRWKNLKRKYPRGKIEFPEVLKK